MLLVLLIQWSAATYTDICTPKHSKFLRFYPQWHLDFRRSFRPELASTSDIKWDITDLCAVM